MHAINSEDEQDDEVGNHHRQVEQIGVIEADEGAVGDLVPVLAERNRMSGEQEL